jgi:hypothetical protein
VTTVPLQLTGLLHAEEKIIWAAQPRPSVFMLRGLPNIAYGVTWSVLGAFWYRGAGGLGHFSAFEGWWRLTPLFSFPFILAGFSFFLYPIRLGARARRTWYVVTNRRVLSVEFLSNREPRVHEFSPENRAALQIKKRAGNLYDLTLSKRALANPELQPPLEAGLFGIEAGESVGEKIRALG